MSVFSENLVRLRKELGISRAQLSMAVGIGVVTLDNIEKGYVSATPQQIEKFSKVFGKSIDELLNANSSFIGEPKEPVFIKEESAPDEPFMDINTADSGLFIDRKPDDRSSYFAYKMPDESMTGYGINKSDILLVREQSFAVSGDIVVMSVSGGRPVVRKLYRMDKTVIGLYKYFGSEENSDDIFDWHSDSVVIRGKVIKSVTFFE